MTTNELKKGQRVMLAVGWQATLVDNARGTIRTADVEGDFRETGSVYAHDIVAYQNSEGMWLDDIEYTPAQLKCKAFAKANGW